MERAAEAADRFGAAAKAASTPPAQPFGAAQPKSAPAERPTTRLHEGQEEAPEPEEKRARSMQGPDGDCDGPGGDPTEWGIEAEMPAASAQPAASSGQADAGESRKRRAEDDGDQDRSDDSRGVEVPDAVPTFVQDDGSQAPMFFHADGSQHADVDTVKTSRKPKLSDRGRKLW